MNIQKIIAVVAALSPTQKTELLAFIREQTTANLDDALDEIAIKLGEMGLLHEVEGVNDARERIAALKQWVESW